MKNNEKNIDVEHICCAIGDPKHQYGVDKKKEWIKSKLKDDNIYDDMIKNQEKYISSNSAKELVDFVKNNY